MRRIHTSKIQARGSRNIHPHEKMSAVTTIINRDSIAHRGVRVTERPHRKPFAELPLARPSRISIHVAGFRTPELAFLPARVELGVYSFPSGAVHTLKPGLLNELGASCGGAGWRRAGASSQAFPGPLRHHSRPPSRSWTQPCRAVFRITGVAYQAEHAGSPQLQKTGHQIRHTQCSAPRSPSLRSVTKTEIQISNQTHADW